MRTPGEIRTPNLQILSLTPLPFRLRGLVFSYVFPWLPLAVVTAVQRHRWARYRSRLQDPSLSWSQQPRWWRYKDSNPAPAACKTAALPHELYPQDYLVVLRVPAGVEPVYGFVAVVAPLYFMGRLDQFTCDPVHQIAVRLIPLLPWRGWDLNPRPLGYEPSVLPSCTTPLLEQVEGPRLQLSHLRVAEDDPIVEHAGVEPAVSSSQNWRPTPGPVLVEPGRAQVLAAEFPLLAWTTLPHTSVAVKLIREVSGFYCSLRLCVDTLPRSGYCRQHRNRGGAMNKLAAALIITALGDMIYRQFFYKGSRRRTPGQHRYTSDCVKMLVATVTPVDSDSYNVLIWGRDKLELGAL